MGSLSNSLFSQLPEVESDEVFRLLGAFRADTHPDCVSLGAGVYLSDEGKSWPLTVVDQVEKELNEQQDIGRHDYLPIEGDPRFLSAARELVFSASPDPASSASRSAIDSRVLSVQTVSGTGSNHIGARFLAETLGSRCVWVSDPTWANHHVIWETAGVARRTYPYYNKSNCTFDFAAMMEVLERESQPRDIVLLHACAHNPTGLDPSREQWMAIAELCHRKELFPFFDSAYQGFASGDPAEDAWAIRYFYETFPSMEMCVAQSFSKNFGLYGHRAGALHVVVNHLGENGKKKVVGYLAQLIRSEYSVPPRYGTTIVRTVLESKSLSQQWIADLQVMSSRIKAMRHALYDELCRLGTPGSWRHIIDQNGMFSYTGLTAPEVEILRTQFHIYMLSSGRISVAGLNTKNVQYVAAAIHTVRTKSLQSQ
ncbi:pyridoxal phosphate-dependent transferase [Xylariales sp. PMI_506]|nr:pyridoxal phosphate-dependent transferase [Xylariales sp. PMI_506]